MAVIALLKELPHDLKFMWRVRAWKDIVLMIVTFSATVLFSLEIGTAISVVLSLLATIKQSSCPRITVLVSLIIQPRYLLMINRAESRKPPMSLSQYMAQEKK